ncbi:copper transporter [Nocardioides sp. KIGAM211]|uniref:Copper transporter n=1 Tax=Nocardioides luti TaxID=2761101 RepID=A0A7X0RCA4_9ACTN|nr:copper transporter [Nocardioides luti]
MITYRHHITTLVAVFLALAVGVVLGGGPLTDLGREPSVAPARAGATRDARELAGFGDDFAAAGAATLYDDRLRDHAVAVLTLPGADDDVVGALTQQVEEAGGTVAGTYAARPSLVAPGEKSLVDTLGSQLMTQLGDGAVASDASTYVRAGQLAGLAMATGDVPADDASSVRQSLAGAELLTSPEKPKAADLVLVVLGTATDDAIVSGLVDGLAAKATGVVVAGDTDSAASGDLAGVRREPVGQDVATVDGVEAPLGQVTAVLALARSLTVQGGSFGASGSDGAVPLG